MNTLRETLARRADEAEIPAVDVDELVATGERRVRRRRAAAVLGSTVVAVVATVVLALVFTSLTGTERSSDPVNRPKQGQSEPAREVVRKIVYADGTEGRTVHYGARKVDTGHTFVWMDVTDDGFVYLLDDGFSQATREQRSSVWFSDGGGVERIGSDACPTITRADPKTVDKVVTDRSGSLVAWFDCTSRVPSLDVYDTRDDPIGGRPRRLAREAETSCAHRPDFLENTCFLKGIVGDHIYWERQVWAETLKRVVLMRYDVATGRTASVTQRDYAADLVNQPRALVLGRSRLDGTPTDGIGVNFTSAGRRLVPLRQLPDGGDSVPTKAFAGSTGDRVQLRLPAGYRTEDPITLFEWLDDDTVALGAGVNAWGGDGKPDADILRCTVSTGRCVLAVPGVRDVRIVPHLLLPG
jgi:hypothetical protein